MRSVDGLQATEIRGPPDFQALVPRHGVDHAVTDGEACDGVGVFYPEPSFVTANGDVVLRESETAETVADGGESRQETVAPLRRCLPDSDFAVLVGGEDFAVAENDGLDRAGGAISAVESVDLDGPPAGEIVDVDAVRGGGVEEASVGGEAGDREALARRREGGHAGVRDGEG